VPQNQVTEIPDAFRWREDTVRFTFVDASRKKECNQGRPNSVMPSDVM